MKCDVYYYGSRILIAVTGDPMVQAWDCCFPSMESAILALDPFQGGVR